MFIENESVPIAKVSMEKRLHFNPKDSERGKLSFSLKERYNLPLLRLDVYPKAGFYSIYSTVLGDEEEFMELCEQCLGHYEKLSDENLQRKKYPVFFHNGLSVVCNQGNKKEEVIERQEITRPLSWKNLQEITGGKEIEFARIDTPSIVFTLKLDKKKHTFGFISNIYKEQVGFIELIRKATKDKVRQVDIEMIYDKIFSILENHSGRSLNSKSFIIL